jgi:hypothetical protein
MKWWDKNAEIFWQCQEGKIEKLAFVVSPLGVNRWHGHKAVWLIEALSQFQRPTPKGITTNSYGFRPITTANGARRHVTSASNPTVFSIANSCDKGKYVSSSAQAAKKPCVWRQL